MKRVIALALYLFATYAPQPSAAQTVIRVIYAEEPSFPAKAQHPNAVRCRAGKYIVDVIGACPKEVEVAAILDKARGIADRERQMTPELYRRAILGTDNGELRRLNDELEDLRK